MADFLISIVVPCYNEADNIRILINRIKKVLLSYRYEIIFVDDGSTDDTLQTLIQLSISDKKIKYISFSRNFGQQVAIRAGIDYAKGDCTITMDADMQHPPESIPEMIYLWDKGFDVVNAIRDNANRLSFVKKWSSKCFYWILSKIADHEVISDVADFRLFDKKVRTIVCNLSEKDLYLRGLFAWIGFKQTTISYDEGERQYGRTKYSTKKMLSLASNGITSSSIRPLRFALSIGIVFAFLAFVYVAYAIIVMFMGLTVSGWASIVASIVFLAGVQLMVLGVMGEYIGKLYMNSKKRPHYIIDQDNI